MKMADHSPEDIPLEVYIRNKEWWNTRLWKRRYLASRGDSLVVLRKDQRFNRRKDAIEFKRVTSVESYCLKENEPVCIKEEGRDEFRFGPIGVKITFGRGEWIFAFPTVDAAESAIRWLRGKTNCESDNVSHGEVFRIEGIDDSSHSNTASPIQTASPSPSLVASFSTDCTSSPAASYRSSPSASHHLRLGMHPLHAIPQPLVVSNVARDLISTIGIPSPATSLAASPALSLASGSPTYRVGSPRASLNTVPILSLARVTRLGVDGQIMTDNDSQSLGSSSMASPRVFGSPVHTPSANRLQRSWGLDNVLNRQSGSSSPMKIATGLLQNAESVASSPDASLLGKSLRDRDSTSVLSGRGSPAPSMSSGFTLSSPRTVLRTGDRSQSLFETSGQPKHCLSRDHSSSLMDLL